MSKIYCAKVSYLLLLRLIPFREADSKNRPVCVRFYFLVSSRETCTTSSTKLAGYFQNPSECSWRKVNLGVLCEFVIEVPTCMESCQSWTKQLRYEGLGDDES